MRCNISRLTFSNHICSIARACLCLTKKTRTNKHRRRIGQRLTMTNTHPAWLMEVRIGAWTPQTCLIEGKDVHPKQSWKFASSCLFFAFSHRWVPVWTPFFWYIFGVQSYLLRRCDWMSRVTTYKPLYWRIIQLYTFTSCKTTSSSVPPPWRPLTQL